jgi:hypothetical protein
MNETILSELRDHRITSHADPTTVRGAPTRAASDTV